MNKLKIAILVPVLMGVFLTSASLTGCSKEDRVTNAQIKASKAVIENRKLYAKEIVKATNDCVKNATSVTNLSMEESDFDSVPEVVESCETQAQKAFGAFSPYYESYVQEWANLEISNERN